MKKRTMAERRSACPLNATLEVLGDRWSLLIVRDLIFKGRTTYKDFLAGGEGIATNVLADRLRRLGAEGVIEKGRDAADARRLVYRLTAKGLALAPVLALPDPTASPSHGRARSGRPLPDEQHEAPQVSRRRPP